MRKVISTWILLRLHQTVDMSPESFGPRAANGRLISQLLQNYEIITIEELDLIEETDQISQCLENFKLINAWLSKLHLTLPKENIHAIVHGVDSACLHLFYTLFLKLKDKEKLHFLTHPKFCAQLGRPVRKIPMRESDEVKPIHYQSSELNLFKEELCKSFSNDNDEDEEEGEEEDEEDSLYDLLTIFVNESEYSVNETFSYVSYRDSIFSNSIAAFEISDDVSYTDCKALRAESCQELVTCQAELDSAVDNKTGNLEGGMVYQSEMSTSSPYSSKNITEVNYENEPDSDHRTNQELISFRAELDPALDNKTGNSEGGLAYQSGMSIPRPSKNMTVFKYGDDPDLDHRTYQELIKLQEEAKNMSKYVPDPKEYERILKKICESNRVRRENEIQSNRKKIMDKFKTDKNKSMVKSEDEGDSIEIKLTSEDEDTIDKRNGKSEDKGNIDKSKVKSKDKGDIRKSKPKSKGDGDNNTSKGKSEDKRDSTRSKINSMDQGNIHSNKVKSEDKKAFIKSKVKFEDKKDINQSNLKSENGVNAYESNVKSKDQVLINVFMKQSSYQKYLVTKFGQAKIENEYMHKRSEKLKFRKILNLDKEEKTSGLINDETNTRQSAQSPDEHERMEQEHNRPTTESLNRLCDTKFLICEHKIDHSKDTDICNISELKISEAIEKFQHFENPWKIKDIIIDEIRESAQSSVDQKCREQETSRRNTESLNRLSDTKFQICENEIDFSKESGTCIIPELKITKDITMPNSIDLEAFKKYHCFEEPWEIEQVQFRLDWVEQINYAANVLGYIIHRALDIRYPPVVQLGDKPHFPKVSTRVCINGLEDTSVLPKLRDLLAERGIKVIEAYQALEYCLEAYRQEFKTQEKVPEDDPKVDNAQMNKAGETFKLENCPKDGIILETFAPIEIENKNDISEVKGKKNQTPLTVPVAEFTFSNQAQLGRTATDLLDKGGKLGDLLLSHIFIEYLKSIPDLKGWALVNYPTNFQQAMAIEEALSGIETMSEISRMSHECKSKNRLQNDEKGYCSLGDYCPKKMHLPLLPNSYSPKSNHDTSLTAFIRMKKVSDDDVTFSAMHEQLNDNLDPLDKFYFDVGANYPMYYKELNWDTIKQLAKLIIGDYSLPLKSSSILLGAAGNLESLTTTKVGQKLRKSKFKSKLDEFPHIPNKKKDKIPIHFVDKSVQTFEANEGTNLLQTEPGKPGWNYTHSHCPGDLLIALATLWETLEESYTHDLTQVFFQIRLSFNSMKHFVQYIKDSIGKIMDLPDQKPLVLSKFQTEFNAVEMNVRKHKEFRGKMCLIIEDFHEILVEMCDLRYMISENAVRDIIDANWAPSEIKELLNNYVTILQIELDRFIKSMSAGIEYYTEIISGLPMEEDLYEATIPKDKRESKSVKNIQPESSKNIFEEDLRNILRDMCKEGTIPKFYKISADDVNQMFENNSTTYKMEYIEEIVENLIKLVQNKIDRVYRNNLEYIEKIQNELEISLKPILTRLESGDIRPDESESRKLVKEWLCVVEGENYRIHLRVELVKKRTLESMKEFLTPIQKCYDQVFDEIRRKYSSQRETIEKICNHFKIAVENGVPLLEEIIVDRHSLCIKSEFDVYKDIAPELPQDILKEATFSTEQLSKLADILLEICPCGYISKKSLFYIIKDEAMTEKLPKLWANLEEASMLKILGELHDDLEYVYWKDFIIYNLRIPFPSERQLDVTRKALRKFDTYSTEFIQESQFLLTNFWFENMDFAGDTQRILGIKNLLFKIYCRNNNGFHYTTMLLDFCKNENAARGFAQALGVSLGKMVCWDFEIGNAFKFDCLKRMQNLEEEITKRDAERDIIYKAAYEEITELVNNIFYVPEVVIEECTASEEKTARKSRRKSSLKKCLEISGKQNENINKSINNSKDSPSTQIIKDLPDNIKTNQKDAKLTDNVKTDSARPTEFIFFLPLEVIINVVTANIPWHLRVENKRDLSFCEKMAEAYEKCRNPDFNMSVLSHEYLHSEMLEKLLTMTKKFSVIDPVRVLSDVLQINLR